MKLVVAYIRHEAFESIRQDLLEAGFPSLSITEVKGSGRQKGITEHYRGSEIAIHLRPKIKIECVVEDSAVGLPMVHTCGSPNHAACVLRGNGAPRSCTDRSPARDEAGSVRGLPRAHGCQKTINPLVRLNVPMPNTPSSELIAMRPMISPNASVTIAM